ncbi:glycerol kinase GlpK [Canibacter sp. lx-72]|uniref:glycerol kinase GlpK n=1 Tax=Canibacter zhuwentaonis TaxID=2837491 RepID=UPI001BDC725C|nr:glycerol kinase GlpK [Canibacter zhuwentaonis]MBT1017692.1 glycerol kinase GlpK [Canibacter zhuwentaonis]
MSKYVIAIDQGTTSSRAIVFDKSGSVISVGQKEHEQILPRAGWVEHDPAEIWQNVQEVIGIALSRADITRHDIASVGITNQRETTVVWDKNTGKPVHNAIVWQDTRTQSIVDEIAGEAGTDKYKAKVGLPLATYFSGTKIKWILDNVEGARKKAAAGDLLFGTTDCWVLWNLTGGKDGGVHATDVTNASRTLFMDLKTLSWDESILADFNVPLSMMPEIRSSSEIYGYCKNSSLLRETPVAGILGDQQAATFGQAAFQAGESKNTYGTGCFLIFQTGEEIVQSENGLLTTVGYKIGDEPAHYALEGSIAVTGSLIQWLRDQLGIISQAPEVEDLAKQVADNGGVYIVPAFSGLFAPYWDSSARGVVTGLTRYSNKNHIARAALEAVAYQTRDVFDAVNADAGVDLTELKVDGGMIANDTLMQFQADVLGVPVIRPVVAETTALGAAYAAGLAVKFWANKDELSANWQEDRRWEPKMDASERERLLRNWKKAVARSKNWVDEDVA